MTETNPVVLLSEGSWHIVAHSRRSDHALCGKRIGRRQAHARLQRVGQKNICLRCLARWRETMPAGKG